MDRIQGLQPAALGHVKDLLLCEPFSVERVAAALGIMKNDLVRRIDFRHPHRLDDAPIISAYRSQVNAALRHDVLSFSGLSFTDYNPENEHIHIMRTAHIGMEDLLYARAKRLERGRGWLGCIRVGLLEASGAFEAPDHIRKDFYDKIDSARPGLHGLADGWDGLRRSLSLRMYDVWYPGTRAGPQDYYVRYA